MMLRGESVINNIPFNPLKGDVGFGSFWSKHPLHFDGKDQHQKNDFANFVNTFHRKQQQPCVSSSSDYLDTDINVGATSTVYPLDDIWADLTQVVCDNSGQYVAAIAQNPYSIYTSQNYGSSFTFSYPPSGNMGTLYQTDIASDAPNYIALATYNGVYTSNNYGVNYNLSTASGLNNFKSVTISSTGNYGYAIYAANTNAAQIFVSKDMLVSFTLLATAPVEPYTDIITSANGQYIYALTSTGYIYTSTDYGITFSSASFSYYPAAISCSSSGQYVGVIGTVSSIYISSNYGQSWTPAIASYPFSGGFYAISLSSSGQNVAVVADGPAVYLSTNYGQTFALTTSSAQYWTSVSTCGSGQYIYAVARQSHIYMSSDMGATWSPLFYDWFGVSSSQTGQYRIAVIANYNDASVYMSSDNGATWNRVTSTTSAIAFPGWFSAACNSDCQYIVLTTTYNQIAISTDYGQTWKAQTFTPPSGSSSMAIADVSISSSGQYITVVTNTGPIYISTNYGASFSPPQGGGGNNNYWASAMSSNGQIQLASAISYAFFSKSTGDNYVFMSADYGSTWNVVDGLPAAQFWSAVTTDSAGVNMAAAAGYGGSVYYSVDSGKTWINSGFSGGNFVAMCQSSSGNVLYVADGGGFSLFNQGYIYISFDFGKTWNTTNSPAQQWGKIACDSTGQYTTATVFEGQVYTSSDWGSTWIPQNITVSNVDIFDDDSTSNSDNSLSGGAIAGIVIASLIGIILAGIAFAVLCMGVALPCFKGVGSKSPLLDNEL